MTHKKGQQQKLPKITERDIEKSILDFLTMFTHVQARKAHTTGLYDPTKAVFRPLQGHSLRGVSDIAIIIRHEVKIWINGGAIFKYFGIAGAIEVKTKQGMRDHLRLIEPGFQPTSHSHKAWFRARDQQAYVDMVNHFGGVAGFATCIEDTQKILEGYL